jgi:hypothetical protein
VRVLPERHSPVTVDAGYTAAAIARPSPGLAGASNFLTTLGSVDRERTSIRTEEASVGGFVMAWSTVGLPNNGRTAHYQIIYDDSLADGVARGTGLWSNCEADFQLMKGWFGGIDLSFDYPVPVIIANASSGGSWANPSPFLDWLEGGAPPAVTLGPGADSSVEMLRYLLVAEVSEMFMLAKGNGWFEPESNSRPPTRGAWARVSRAS